MIALPSRRPRLLGTVAGVASVLIAVVVWLILLGPFVALLAHISPHAIRMTLGAPGALDLLWTSLEASAVALVSMVLLGTPLSYLLARGRLPAPRLVETGVILPLLMPPLVIGLLLIFVIGRTGFPGTALNDLSPNVFGVNTFFALVVAEFYEAAPYYVLSATAAFSTVDARLESDAQLLGDRPATAFAKVTIPLAAPGLAAGLAISWARAMAAFGAVLIVAYNPAGLPLQIDTAFIENGLSGAMPYALLLVVAALPLPLLAFLWAARAPARSASTEAAGL